MDGDDKLSSPLCSTFLDPPLVRIIMLLAGMAKNSVEPPLVRSVRNRYIYSGVPRREFFGGGGVKTLITFSDFFSNGVYALCTKHRPISVRPKSFLNFLREQVKIVH